MSNRRWINVYRGNMINWLSLLLLTRFRLNVHTLKKCESVKCERRIRRRCVHVLSVVAQRCTYFSVYFILAEISDWVFIFRILNTKLMCHGGIMVRNSTTQFRCGIQLSAFLNVSTNFKCLDLGFNIPHQSRDKTIMSKLIGLM